MRCCKGWPFFGGYYITINEYNKNVGGNQSKLIDGKVKSSKKQRKRLQVNIIAPSEEAIEKFDSVFGLEDVGEEHDLFMTTNPKLFGKQHNNEDDEDNEDNEETEDEDD